MDRVKELSSAHWDYIHALLTAHGLSGESLRIVGFHYVTAFEHGYKHAVQDAKEQNNYEDTVR